MGECDQVRHGIGWCARGVTISTVCSEGSKPPIIQNQFKIPYSKFISRFSSQSLLFGKKEFFYCLDCLFRKRFLALKQRLFVVAVQKN